MNWVERLHRFVLEFILFAVMFMSFPNNSGIVFKLSGAFLVSHTLMVIINGHLVALCVHDLFWFSLYRKKKRFLHYMEEMKARLDRKSPAYLKGVYFWGSLARGDFKPTSDLDIRFIPKNGFYAAFCVSHLVFIERFHALMAGFPLDAYMFRTWKETRKKMDVANEPAVSLYVNINADVFGDRATILFEQFKKTFIEGLNEADR